MRILFVCDALLTGGAETFALRLSSAMARREHVTALVALRPDLVNLEQYSQLATNVELIRISLPPIGWVRRIDGVSHRARLGFSLLRNFQERRLMEIIRAKKPDVVHSSLITSDLVVSRACARCHVPWISTMHGDYLALEEKGSSRAARIPDFTQACLELERSVGHIVCISDQQMRQLKRLMPVLESQGNISKIYNGYEPAPSDASAPRLPVALEQIPRNAFVVGMVSRGIKEKGWDVLLRAFEELNLLDAWLVFVGDGEHLRGLKALNKHPRVVFCGNVADPLRYIACFDVACLPSRYRAESLPTVVIEYMLMGKPVLASAAGEIPTMIEAFGPKPAGLLVPHEDDAAMVSALRDALMRLHADPALRSRLRSNALCAVRKFDMGACADAYLRLYAEMMQ